MLPRRAASMLALAALAVTISLQARADGSPAFSFRVPSLSGGTLSSEDLKGKIAILDVWATWCGPCRVVIPELQRIHDRYKGKGVTVIGLSADPQTSGGGAAELVKQFVKEFGIRYPIGLMNDGAFVEVMRLAGADLNEALTIPMTFVLGRDGRVMKLYLGYFPGQEAEIETIVNGILASEAARAQEGKP